MSSILFPLRSSCGWFAGPDSRSSLEARVKCALVLYENLIFQDGRFKLTVWDRSSFDVMMAPGSIPDDRTSLKYFKPGTGARLAISENGSGSQQVLAAGPILAGYEVDFYPILLDAGLLGQPFVELQAYEVDKTTEAAIKSDADRDASSEELASALDGNHFLKQSVIRAIHLDSSLARYLKASLTTDFRAGPYIARKNKAVARAIWHQDFKPFVLDTLASLVVPDVSQLPWDQVGRMRDSSAGVALRATVERMALELVGTAADLNDPKDVQVVVQRLLINDLVAELREHQPRLKDIVVDLALNFIPYGGAASLAEGVREYLAHHRSWFSLLRQPE